MKYFIDTEFHSYFHKPLLSRKTHHRLELISIAMCCEDGRELYLFSKEFDLKKAWKNHWLRENVLKQVYQDLLSKEGTYSKTYHPNLMDWSYKGLKNLIRWHGSTNKEIADAIFYFTRPDIQTKGGTYSNSCNEYNQHWDTPVFYGDHCSFDYVILSSLFGTFEEWPVKFPKLIYDVQQMLDERALISATYDLNLDIKNMMGYPKNACEHSAICDARQTKALYHFATEELK